MAARRGNGSRLTRRRPLIAQGVAETNNVILPLGEFVTTVLQLWGVFYAKKSIELFTTDATPANELAQVLDIKDVTVQHWESADKFIASIKGGQVDLMILEQDATQRQSGLDILERLPADLLRPTTILITERTSVNLLRAQKVSVDSILQSDCSIDRIIETVEKLLSSLDADIVTIPTLVKELIQECDAIQPLPQVKVKISASLNDDSIPLSKLAKDIAEDPEVTAKLLKLVNSSAFGLRNKVTKVGDAVSLLGSKRTAILIIASYHIASQNQLLKGLPDWLRKWYHRRSVLIAGTASAFSRRFEKVSHDTAYLVGLFQYLGVLVLAGAHRDRYFSALQRVEKLAQLRLEVVENETFRMNHAEVSAALVDRWKMPKTLVAPVLNHHRPDIVAHMPKIEQRFYHVMAVGDALANLTDNAHLPRVQRFNKLLASYGAGRAEGCKTCIGESIAKAVESARLFSVPMPDETVMAKMKDNLVTMLKEARQASKTE